MKNMTIALLATSLLFAFLYLWLEPHNPDASLPWPQRAYEYAVHGLGKTQRGGRSSIFCSSLPHPQRRQEIQLREDRQEICHSGQVDIIERVTNESAVFIRRCQLDGYTHMTQIIVPNTDIPNQFDAPVSCRESYYESDLDDIWEFDLAD